MQHTWVKLCAPDIRALVEQVLAGNTGLDIQELRLRAGQPLSLRTSQGIRYVTRKGAISRSWQDAFFVSTEHVRDTLAFVSRYSVYALEEEIRNGFITIPGGHRVGLAGTAVVKEERITGLSSISSLNIRVAGQVIGCAAPVYPALFEKERFCNTLIVSPPGLGKTTLLRDLIRLLSNGHAGRPAMTVCVIDERGELGACAGGMPCNDLGRNTDVLTGAPKASGLRMLLRSMTPDVLAADELGGEEDTMALLNGLHSGCRLVATVHGDKWEDLEGRKGLAVLLRAYLIERIVILRRQDGMVRCRVQNEKGETLYDAWR